MVCNTTANTGHECVWSLAAGRTDKLLASGADALAALNGGYHMAFVFGAIFAAAAALIGAIFLRVGSPSSSAQDMAADSMAETTAVL